MLTADNADAADKGRIKADLPTEGSAQAGASPKASEKSA
jgi:hypothetical protein